MQIRRLGSFIAVLILAGASVSWAYTGWGPFASYWDTKDGDSAVAPGVRLSFEAVEGVQMDISASFFSDLAKGDADLKVTPLEAGLALCYPAGELFNLCIGGGIGYYFVDSDIHNVDSKIGGFVMGRVELKALNNKEVFYGKTDAALFVEPMYRFVDTGDVDLSGPAVNAGLLIRW